LYLNIDIIEIFGKYTFIFLNINMLIKKIVSKKRRRRDTSNNPVQGDSRSSGQERLLYKSERRRCSTIVRN